MHSLLVLKTMTDLYSILSTFSIMEVTLVMWHAYFMVRAWYLMDIKMSKLRLCSHSDNSFGRETYVVHRLSNSILGTSII